MNNFIKDFNVFNASVGFKPTNDFSKIKFYSANFEYVIPRGTQKSPLIYNLFNNNNFGLDLY